MAGSKKKSYLKDFSEDARGEFHYTGGMLGFAGCKEEYRKAFCVLAGSMLALTAVILGSGFIDAESAHGSFYIILPYIGEVSAAFALIWNMVKILSSGRRIRSYVYESAVPKIGPACLILAFFAAAGAGLSGFFVLQQGTADPAGSILYIALKILALGIALFIRKVFSGMRWDPIKE